jgi:hypothetical protein
MQVFPIKLPGDISKFWYAYNILVLTSRIILHIN